MKVNREVHQAAVKEEIESMRILCKRLPLLLSLSAFGIVIDWKRGIEGAG
jgi:hypothetical protein